MKKAVILIGAAVLMVAGNVCAQVHDHEHEHEHEHEHDHSHEVAVITVNIDMQPAWGLPGYDYVGFYYIPALNIYYDVTNRLFHFKDGQRWMISPYLPVSYAYYDFYSLYKVVLKNVRKPWKHNRRHRRIYAEYSYIYTQVPLFYMDEPRYHIAKGNFFGWVESRYMPANSGRPPSREFSKNPHNGRISGEYRPAVNSRGSDTAGNRSGRKR
ncbi:MAG: hypothetical protein LBJ47_03720 [Tannerella sp.]|jgi:ABC-type nickel/cobalt efflux system permease component RcnA|nr:hypothetical protein [Tannerella sp.]